jgi:hypothetical protein
MSQSSQLMHLLSPDICRRVQIMKLSPFTIFPLEQNLLSILSANTYTLFCFVTVRNQSFLPIQINEQYYKFLVQHVYLPLQNI